jgi:hypothetical protein
LREGFGELALAHPDLLDHVSTIVSAPHRSRGRQGARGCRRCAGSQQNFLARMRFRFPQYLKSIRPDDDAAFARLVCRR